MTPDEQGSLHAQLAVMRADLNAIEARVHEFVSREMTAFSGKWGFPIRAIDIPVSCFKPYGSDRKISKLGEVTVRCSVLY